jgi:hypothetical protein
MSAKTPDRIKEVLELAGVKASLSAVIEGNNDDNIYVLKIAEERDLRVAQIFSSVSDQTGFSPVVPIKRSVQALTENIQQQNTAWQERTLMESSDSAESTETAMAAFKNVAIPPHLQAIHAKLNEIRQFEKETLQRYCKPGMSLSSALIAAGESLDVDKWLQLKKNPEMEVGDFSWQANQLARLPFCPELLLVPVKASWQIPAYLRIGDWNDNPPTQVHIALLKRWYERFGAKLTFLDEDAMYLTLEHPVEDREQALELAIEQFAYCPDNILQGHGDGTFSGEALNLLGSKIWPFWWD